MSLAGFNGASHDVASLRVANGTVTFTGSAANFYFKQPVTITADSGAVIRFTQTGPFPFNLNGKTVTFDGDGTTIFGSIAFINNIGNIVKTGSGTLVLTASNTFTGSVTILGGTLRLAMTDAPVLWLDATNDGSLVSSGTALAQWNDANGRGTFVSQSTAANQPSLITDLSLAGPAKSLVDFGAYAYYSTATPTAADWMQFNAAMTDIRAMFWVGKTSNDNFLLGSTATDYHFHSGGPGAAIWNSTYASANIRNGTTWLNGAAVTGTTTIMPAASNLVRIGAFTTANVSANTLARDRTNRYGGEQIGEVMMFNTTLTSQQQLDVDAYLAKKWFNTGTGIGNRLPAATIVSLGNGGVLDLSGVNFQTLAGINASDGSGSRVQLGGADLTIDGTSNSAFDGVISGDGALLKTGAGSFSLGGASTYTGPTTLTAGTLDIEGSVTSNVTVKGGATLINNGTINGDILIETGGIYLGDGTVTGSVTTPPPVVAITSPAADGIGIPGLQPDLRVTAAVTFNAAFGAPVVSWSLVSGPGTATFENPAAADTRVHFSATGTYTLRCTATVTVNGQALQGLAERTVQADASPTVTNTVTFREGVNGYGHIATFIRGDSGTWNSGARDQLLIGRFNNQPMRGLFSFALAGIPANSTITSAAFDLWIAATSTGSVNNLELRPLLKDIVEGTGNSNSSATVGAGSGADWNSRTGSTTANLWGTPGGQSGTDFSTTVIGSYSGFDTAALPVGTQCAFSLPPAFLTEANAALSAARPLRFMLTMAGDTSGSNIFARFVSDDHATTALRPQLSITYSTGTPSAPTVAPGTAPAAMRGVSANLSGTTSGATGSIWELVSGPGTAAFGDETSPATTVVFSEPGDYVLRLAASNALGEVSRTLAVSVARNPAVFEDWQALNWPGVTDENIIGPSADPDHDGLANLMEWATLSNPKASTPAIGSLVKNGSNLEFSYTRRKVAAGQATFTVEYSDTLAAGSWSSSGIDQNPTPSFDDDTTQTLTVIVPAGTGPKRFVRLKITKP